MSQSSAAGFLQHIEELRQRLLRAIVGLGIGTVVSAIFAQQLLEWLAQPVGGLENLEAIEVTENMGVFMQVSLLGGVTLAMPIILFQMWRFIAPGLHKNERRYVYVLLPMATLLFLVGAGFAYFVMLPAAIPFLMGVIKDIVVRPRPANYVSFITSLMFWIGVSFEAPLLVYFLARVGIVDHRMLTRNWRIAILLIALLSAVITPTPDPVNMGLVMLPLFLLYGLSIIMARIARRPSKEEV